MLQKNYIKIERHIKSGFTLNIKCDIMLIVRRNKFKKGVKEYHVLDGMLCPGSKRQNHFPGNTGSGE